MAYLNQIAIKYSLDEEPLVVDYRGRDELRRNEVTLSGCTSLF
jgi:hypothetical protein